MNFDDESQGDETRKKKHKARFHRSIRSSRYKHALSVDRDAHSAARSQVFFRSFLLVIETLLDIEQGGEKEREREGRTFCTFFSFCCCLTGAQLSHLPIGPSHVLICLLVNPRVSSFSLFLPIYLLTSFISCSCSFRGSPQADLSPLFSFFTFYLHLSRTHNFRLQT